MQGFLGSVGRRLVRLVLLFAALTGAAAPAAAHDLPMDLVVKAFVKPEGQTLTLLVRVPMKAITDIEFPRRSNEFLDLARIDPALRDAATTWVAGNVRLYEGDTRLPAPRVVSTRISLESDGSFTGYGSALAHVTGAPLPPETTLYWEQGLLDVQLEYPIRSDRSKFSIHTGLQKLAQRTVTTVDFLPPHGPARAYALEDDAGLVRLDPSWSQAAGRFVALGFHHILSGADHLLFLLCLVIPFRRVRPLIPIVTAFTVAHSVTLVASAYGFAPTVLWFQPLIETLIAMSILYMALENIVTDRPAARWIITFVFGLVHGFGFSFVLQHTLQFSGSHVLLSLLSFNIGVELGQLLVLVLLVPLLNALFKYVAPERIGPIILSAIVAHTAWHWMAERFAVLSEFPGFQIKTGGIIAVAASACLTILVMQLRPRLAAQKIGELSAGERVSRGLDEGRP